MRDRRASELRGNTVASRNVIGLQRSMVGNRETSQFHSTSLCITLNITRRAALRPTAYAKEQSKSLQQVVGTMTCNVLCTSFVHVMLGSLMLVEQNTQPHGVDCRPPHVALFAGNAINHSLTLLSLYLLCIASVVLSKRGLRMGLRPSQKGDI